MSSVKINNTELSKYNMAKFDLVIVACGFEERSSYIGKTFGLPEKRTRCFSFIDRHKLSYKKNFRFFKDLNIAVEPVSDAEFEEAFASELSRLPDGDVEAKVAVDISSFNRRRIAAVIASWVNHAQRERIELSFFYSDADASNVPGQVPLTSQGVVHPAFAGWSNYPERPIYAIVSAGYEEEKVVASLEALEVREAIVFRTSEERIDYFNLVTKANQSLWLKVGDDRIFQYDLFRPIDLYLALENLVFRCAQRYRIVVLPFGPKIFAAISMLVSLDYSNEVTIWNCSGGSLEKPVDRKPNGRILGFSVQIAKAPA